MGRRIELTGILTIVLLTSSAASSQSLSKRFTLCVEGESLVVSNQKLSEVRRFHSTQIHRFEQDRVYLSTSTRSEYYYNIIKEVEFGRFVAGHKTYIFDSYQSGRGSVIHIDNLETKINSLECRKR